MRSPTVSRYAVDRRPCRIDLSDNTNAWGMPPAARRAIAEADLSSRYPSDYADDLKAAVADYTGMPLGAIVTGCGSDDVLDATIRAVGKPGDRLAFVAPTFVMVPVFAELNGLVPTPVGFEQLAASGARVIYICSPNNPTGELRSRDAIERVLRESNDDQVVIVDEAYAEFAGVSVVDLTSRYDRLVVARTMSKAFGLAGLRVGYAVANPGLIAAIEASRGPFKVSTLSEAAAVAALREGRPWMTQHVAQAIEVRDRLAAELRTRGLEPLQSAANFLFVPIADAPAIGEALVAQGIRVRAFAKPSGLRIAVAPWPQIQELLDALDEVRR